MSDTAVMMQGVAVPQSAVNPQAFFALTRRQTIPVRTFNFTGLGMSDNVPMLQTGILAGLSLKLTGSVVVTPGAGTVASTARWPYDLIKALRFSANGQSNLINVSGQKLKARDLMARGDLDDRGVSRGIGGASPGTARTQGTLSQASEDWGVGQNVTSIAGATYPFELTFYVPIAFDHVNLLGAVFAQTSATDLNLAIDWASQSDLFTLTGDATVDVSCAVVAEAVLYSIPQLNGEIVVPDLSMFHSLIQTRFANPSNGMNEIRLSGQGVGRQLLRVFWQVYNGAVPSPLPVNATNFAQVGWRYGGNDTPEVWTDGQHLRYFQERWLNSDIAPYAGIALIDFASEHAFRDSVDEGAASDLRLLIEIGAGVALTSPFVEYVQETAFAGAVGA